MVSVGRFEAVGLDGGPIAPANPIRRLTLGRTKPVTDRLFLSLNFGASP